MFSLAMPKAVTAAMLVERATKCLQTSASVGVAPESGALEVRNQRLADSALVMVSCVVKVLEATMNSVVSLFRCLMVSTRCVPSMFDTKCTRNSGDEYGLSASHTITGPRSLPTTMARARTRTRTRTRE